MLVGKHNYTPEAFYQVTKHWTRCLRPQFLITSPPALQCPSLIWLLFSQPSLSAGPWVRRSGNFSFHSPAVFQLCSLSFGQSSQTPPGHPFKVHVSETERTISRPYRGEWPRHPSRFQARKPSSALLPSHPINPSPRPVHSACQMPLWFCASPASLSLSFILIKNWLRSLTEGQNLSMFEAGHCAASQGRIPKSSSTLCPAPDLQPFPAVLLR